jgi:hypothetical protein
MADYQLEFHGKRHSDFDLRRIIQAQEQGFTKPVTAYLSDVFFVSGRGYGVVFGHSLADKFGRFDDGRLLSTSLVVSVGREGRFWVLTTQDSRFVIATFKRGNGRKSFKRFKEIPGIVV